MRTRLTIHLDAPLLRPGALRLELERIVAKTAFDYEREVKEQMRAPKSGRTYRRGKITRAASARLPVGLRSYETAKGNKRVITGYKIHRASAAGEAPAVDLGGVINSIRTKPEGTNATIIAGNVAAILEYQMNRPVFEPTLEKIRPGFNARIDEAVERLCQ